MQEITPEQIVQIAKRYGAPAVASSYNEPLITSEWSVAVFEEAKAGRPAVLLHLQRQRHAGGADVSSGPLVDAYKVDLKSFNDKHYRELGGVLENVVTTIRMLKEMGFWVEIVTLLVPVFNTDPDELKQMAEFLAGVDPLMPWHITAFHSDYKMDNTPDTSSDDLLTRGRSRRRRA